MYNGYKFGGVCNNEGSQPGMLVAREGAAGSWKMTPSWCCISESLGVSELTSSSDLDVALASPHEI